MVFFLTTGGLRRFLFIMLSLEHFVYRNQAEMAHTCRGSIRLQGALIHTEETCNFVISNAGTNTFHLRASNEVERQRWITALELAKSKAVKACDSGGVLLLLLISMN